MQLSSSQHSPHYLVCVKSPHHPHYCGMACGQGSAHVIQLNASKLLHRGSTSWRNWLLHSCSLHAHGFVINLKVLGALLNGDAIERCAAPTRQCREKNEGRYLHPFCGTIESVSTNSRF